MFKRVKKNQNAFGTVLTSAVIALTLAACGGGDSGEAPSKYAAAAARSPLPLVTITDNLGGEAAAGPITFNFSFDRDVGGSFTADDIDVIGGAKGAFVRQSGSLATLVVMPAPNTKGAVQVRLAAGSVTDTTGASNAAVSVSKSFNTEIPGQHATLASFEEDPKPDLIGFAGAEDASVVTDPSDRANKVARIVKSASADPRAGTTLATCPMGTIPRLPLTATMSKISARIWSPVAGTPVRLKVENAADPSQSVETESVVSVASGWQKISFDFAIPVNGSPALNSGYTYNKLSIFFDYGTMGAATGTRTYLLDDLAFVDGSVLPSCATASASTSKVAMTTITMDEASPPTITSLGGAEEAGIIVERQGSINKVARIVKSAASERSAGAAVSTLPDNQIAPIGFSATAKTITMRVWAPTAGARVRMKVTNSGNPAKSAETEATVSVANAWQTLSFNFHKPVAGSEPLDITATYNRLSIIFDFGTNGSAQGAQTFFFDDVSYPTQSNSGIDRTTIKASADMGTTASPPGAVGEQLSSIGSGTKSILAVASQYRLSFRTESDVKVEYYVRGSFTSWLKPSSVFTDVPSGTIVRVRFLNENGIEISSRDFVVGQTNSYAVSAPGGGIYKFGIKSDTMITVPRIASIYADYEPPLVAVAPTGIHMDWELVGGGRNSWNRIIQEVQVGEALKNKVRAAGELKWPYGDSWIVLKVDTLNRLWLQVVKQDGGRVVIGRTILNNDWKLSLRVGYEFDAFFGYEGSPEDPVSSTGPLEAQFYLQFALTNPALKNVEFRMRLVANPRLTTGCTPDGCDLDNFFIAQARQEFRIAYTIKSTNQNIKDTLVQLVWIPVANNLITYGFPTDGEKAFNTLGDVLGGARLLAQREETIKNLMNGAANSIVGNTTPTPLVDWVPAQLLRGFGGGFSTAWVRGVFNFSYPTTRATLPTKGQLFEEWLDNIPAVKFPNKLPPWAVSLHKNIPNDQLFGKFTKVTSFTEKIPAIGTYKYSAKSLFANMSPAVKEAIIKKVLAGAMAKTFSDGVPGDAAKTKLVGMLPGESVVKHTERVSGLLAANAVKSLAEVFNSEEFWRAVASEVFGDVSEQLTNYARRVANFIALGGTAAAAAVTLAGGVDAPDVPGYQPPPYHWNVDTSLANGVTAQYKVGSGAFTGNMPRELASGTVLTVRFTLADGTVRDEAFRVGTAEVKQDLTSTLTVWATTVPNTRVYTVRAELKWDIALSLDAGVTTQYKIGSESFTAAKPAQLPQGTALTVRFKLVDGTVRDEAFVVGTAEAKKDLTSGLTVWATVVAATGVYTVRAEVKLWTIASRLDTGTTALYKVGNGSFTAAKPAQLPQGTTLTVRFKLGDGTVRDEAFVVGTAEAKKELTPRLTVWATTVPSARFYTVQAELKWQIALVLDAGVTVQAYKVAAGAFTATKPAPLSQGLLLTVKFRLADGTQREEPFVVGTAEGRKELTPRLTVWATVDANHVYTVRAEVSDPLKIEVSAGSGIWGVDSKNAQGYFTANIPQSLTAGTPLTMRFSWGSVFTTVNFTIGTARDRTVYSVAGPNDFKQLVAWSTLVNGVYTIHAELESIFCTLCPK